MQYRYTNPNTKQTGIVDARTYQDMVNNHALKGYTFEPLGSDTDAIPPAITPPTKFQEQANKSAKRKNKSLRSNGIND